MDAVGRAERGAIVDLHASRDLADAAGAYGPGATAIAAAKADVAAAAPVDLATGDDLENLKL